MKVAIFGATGRTGRPLVEQALGRGYRVTAFVRDPSKLGPSHERLTVIGGDILDGSAVERAVSGQDAVVGALGHAKGSPKDVQTRGTANIVAAMRKHGPRARCSRPTWSARWPTLRPGQVVIMDNLGTHRPKRVSFFGHCGYHAPAQQL